MRFERAGHPTSALSDKRGQLAVDAPRTAYASRHRAVSNEGAAPSRRVDIADAATLSGRILRAALAGSTALVPVGLVCGFLGTSTPGQAQTWTGTTSADYNTATNWSTNTVPSVGATATFDGTTPNNAVNVSASVQPNGFVYNAGAAAYTVTVVSAAVSLEGGGIQNNSGTTQNLAVDDGQALQLIGGDVVNTGAGSQTIITVNGGGAFLQFIGTSNGTDAQVVGAGGVVDLQSSAGTVTIGSLSGSGFVIASTDSGGAAAQTLVVGGLNLSTTYSGAINPALGVDPANIALTKVGTGTLTLTGANGYTGLTTVSAGTLVAGSATALGTTDAGTTVAAGANLTIANVAIGGEAVTLNGGTALSGTGTASLAGNITLATATPTITTPAAGDALTLSGVIDDGGNGFGITKAGAGTLTLTGANTFTGATTINAGVLALGHVTGTTIDAAGTGQITVNTAAELVTTTTGTLSNNLVFGNGTETLAAASGTTVTLQGGNLVINTSNVHFGDAVNSGTIVVSAAVEAADNAATLSVDFGTLRDGGGLGFFVLNTSQTSVNNSATLDINDHTDTIANLQGTSTTATVNIGTSTATVLSVLQGSFAGVISGAGGLTKANAGTLTLSGASTYTGRTTISGGTLALSGAASIASSSGVLNSSNFDISQISGAGTTLTAYAGAGTTFLGSKTLTITTAAGTVDGVISDGGLGGGAGGGLILSGGALTLTAANTYTGATVVNGGTLTAANATALGTTAAGTTVAAGGNLTIANVAIGTEAVTLNGGTALSGTGTASLAGNITLATSTSTITTPAAGDALTLSGVIADGGNGIGITKAGAGTLTLSAADTYTGATTVNAGTLTIAAAGSITSNVTNSATFNNNGTVTGTLGNSGTASNTITITGTVNNSGNFTNSGGVGGLLTNTAGTTINSGTLNSGATVTGGTLTSTGTITGAVTNSATVNAQNTITGAVVNNAGATFTVTGALAGITSLTNDGTFTLGGNSITTQSLTSTTTSGIIQDASATAATLTTGDATSTTYAGVLQNGAGGGSLTLTKQGSGVLNLTGTNTVANNFAGTINVNAGTLAINGTIGDVTANTATLNVNNGGTLHGSGIFDGNVVVNAGGTVSAGNSPGTLTVGGNYTLNANSDSLFELGQTGVVGGPNNDLIKVGGNLTLGGTLTLKDGSAQPLTSGIYQIFQYGGTVTGQFATIDSGDASSDVIINSNAPNPRGANVGQVDVLLRNGQQVVQFWDGADAVGNGTVDGGTGTWSTAGTNWTTQPNAGVNDNWQSQVGIFSNVGGTVTVAGTQSFQGLQFTANNYIVTAGTLNLTSDPTTTAGAGTPLGYINVDAGITARINSAITGTNVGLSVNPVGGETGVLQIGGTASYTGLTQVSNGTLEIVSGGAINGSSALNNAALVQVDAGGAMTLGGGTGTVTNTGTVANAGTVQAVVASNTGTIGNTGTWTGAVQSNAGTVNNSGTWTTTAGGFVTGGTVNTSGTLDATTGGLTNTGTVNASAGAVNGAIANNAGGVFNVTGPVTSANTFANAANATLNVTAPGNYQIAGALTNGGTVNFAGTLASANFTNNATVNGTGGAANGPITNNGTFNVTGTVTSNSTFANGAAGQLAVTAGGNYTIAQLLTNAGAINVAGTLTDNAGITNTATGTILNTGTINDDLNNAGTVTNNGTYNANAINSGTINNNATWNGNLTNLANGTVVNVGTWTGNVTNAGSISGSGVFIGNFGNTGTLVANSPTTRVNGTLTNSGTIDLTSGATVTNRLTATNYVGVAGSQALVNVDLSPTAGPGASGSGGQATQLVFNSSAGTSALKFTNLTTQANIAYYPVIPVVVVPGGDNTFVADPASLAQLRNGFVTYSYANGNLLGNINAAQATAAGGQIASIITTLNSDFFQDWQPFITAPQDPDPNSISGGPWIRGKYGQENVDATAFSGNNGTASRVNTEFSGFQVGADIGRFNINKSGWNVIGGITGGEVFANSTEKTTGGIRGNFEIPFVGVYGAITNGPFHADALYRHDFYGLKLNDTIDQTNTRIAANGDSYNFDTGYNIQVGPFGGLSNFFVEPSASVIVSDVKVNPLTFGGNLGRIRFNDIESVLGRAGLRIGTSIVNDKVALQPFFAASVWHEFDGNATSNLDINNLTLPLSVTRVGTFGQFGLGLNGELLGQNILGTIRADFRVGDKLDGESVTGQLRYQF